MYQQTHTHTPTCAVGTLQMVRCGSQLIIPMIGYVYIYKLNSLESEVGLWPFSDLFIIFVLSCKSVVFLV